MTLKKPEDTRILVVDDDPLFRTMLGMIFKRKGYQIEFAASGNEAFEKIKAQPMDVVISDIQMPDGDGISLLDRTREHHLETPIVLLVTGFSDLTTEEAHNKGAEAMFGKPFDRKTLEATVLRLLTPREERWSGPPENVEAELKVQLEFMDMDKAIETKVINIGRGGIFVTLSDGQYPNVSDTVSFKIAFGDGQSTLSGNGIVRWVRTHNTEGFPSGCGIEFTYLGQPELQKILDYISTKKSKAYIPNK